MVFVCVFDVLSLYICTILPRPFSEQACTGPPTSPTVACFYPPNARHFSIASRCKQMRVQVVCVCVRVAPPTFLNTQQLDQCSTFNMTICIFPLVCPLTRTTFSNLRPSKLSEFQLCFLVSLLPGRLHGFATHSSQFQPFQFSAFLRLPHVAPQFPENKNILKFARLFHARFPHMSNNSTAHLDI